MFFSVIITDKDFIMVISTQELEQLDRCKDFQLQF